MSDENEILGETGNMGTLKNFQISKISEMISGTVYAGLGGYYFNRNARFSKNRNYANGKLDVKAMFSDRLEFDGKQNYANLGWEPVQIVNRIVSGLVGRWMGRNEKISIDATDTISVKQKNEEFEELEFWITNREKMEALQQASGVKVMPDNIP